VTLSHHTALHHHNILSFPTRRSSDLDNPCGMPAWQVNPVNMNLVVQDVPMWYKSEIGLNIAIEITYNSQDSLNQLRPFGNKWIRSEEHTSELQSRVDIVCRLLLEKKK